MYGDLWREAGSISSRLKERPEQLKALGKALAEAERAYRVALRKEMLGLRASGLPASMVADVARGEKGVADLKCVRDCAEAVYKTEGEAINVDKLRLRLLDAQMQREWTSGGMA